MAKQKAFGIDEMTEDLKRLPFLRWLKKTADRYAFLRKNKSKNLMLGVENTFSNVEFGNYNYIGNDNNLSNVSIGDYSYINSSSKIQRADIGKFTCIGTNVTIGLGIHPTNLVSTHPTFYTNKKPYYFSDDHLVEEYKPVVIGNDVWIGNNCLILDGVELGDGAVIASGCVVTKDVMPYTIVGGVPAKLIKNRFTEEQKDRLQQIKWWDWSIHRIKENKLLFRNLEAFLSKEA